MNNVLIVGLGIVGSHLKTLFTDADVYDKYKPDVCTIVRDKVYDVAFIAVPTPMDGQTGQCITSDVEDAIWLLVNDYKVKTVCVKSTVFPGFTNQMEQKLSTIAPGMSICFSPEYCGETIHSHNIDEGFVIVGGKPEPRNRVAQVMQSIKQGSYLIKFTDSLTAELVKYMENSFLAMKVTFSNEFYRIANANGVSYDELRQLFIMDPRVNPSHTIVYPNKPYYRSKCFDKDIPAIITHSRSKGYDPIFLQAMVDTNIEFSRS